MKKSLHSSLTVTVIGAALFTVVACARASVSMQLIADNDFALFAGTDTGVTSLIYQNNVTWSAQVSALQTFSFDLQPGETTFYLLGMGGGGQENVSGTVNGVDLTTIDVSMSSDIRAYLSGYDTGQVSGGAYNAGLSDVQGAFSLLTWGSPTVNTSDTVITQSPTGRGFHFDDSTAHLFSFTATDVNVPVVPEPSTRLLLLIAGGAIAASCFRHSSRRSLIRC